MGVEASVMGVAQEETYEQMFYDASGLGMVFGEPKSWEQVLKENRRLMQRCVRQLQREEKRLDAQESKILKRFFAFSWTILRMRLPRTVQNWVHISG